MSGQRAWLLAGALLAVAIAACAIYANLSFAVSNPANYRYFPPFRPNVNVNNNRALGAEYFNIAQSLAAGTGFAQPFGQTSNGPTAWMPPLLSFLEAGLLRACGEERDAVMIVMIALQVLVLVGTGLLILALVKQTASRVGAGVAAAVYFLALVFEFKLCFQVTHDSWLVLLALDLLVAGYCWYRPFSHWGRAAGWGVLGGFCALVNPIAGFVWGTLSLLSGWRQRAWVPLGLALLLAGITLTPWTFRNYLAFGRFIPVKSNMAYELYQSQCLQADGLIQRTTFGHHPGNSGNREGQEYIALGEIAYLDKKSEQFWKAVWANPLDFLDRVAQRFLGTTLWYVPFDRANAPKQGSVVYWIVRVIFPLPCLAVLLLLFSAFWKPLGPAHWTVIGVYCFYLLPYIAASYYERYGMPLLGVKVLLVLWAVDRVLALRPTGRAKVPTRGEKGRQVRNECHAGMRRSVSSSR
jgi:hypothetical protein